MSPESKQSQTPASNEQEQLQLANRRQYITQRNLDAMITVRNLRVNLTIAEMEREILPDTAAHLRREFLNMAAMFEAKQEAPTQ